jgi:eukaryotic-like serine/threonine-protein kinase
VSSIRVGKGIQTSFCGVSRGARLVGWPASTILEHERTDTSSGLERRESEVCAFPFTQDVRRTAWQRCVGVDCPSEELISAFTRDELERAVRARIERHIDECSDCARVITDLVRIFEASNHGPAFEKHGSSEDLSVTEDTEGIPDQARDASRLDAGARVGRYRVFECVGAGGMGAVYAAYDPDLDRRVALKLLHGDEQNETARARNQRLLREAQALARLAHPNVITVHDVGTFDGRVFVAMEFVSGMTLKQWIATGPHGWKATRSIFVAAGQGLAAAHAAGLVHRDFKPENVLIGLAGPPHEKSVGRVRVTDFGLARMGEPRAAQSAFDLRHSLSDPDLDSEEIATTLTRPGALVGTPAYMAPEQWEALAADEKSDQFSFCVALFEALHGHRPFAGHTLGELCNNVVAGKIRTPKHDPRIPLRVRRAVMRGLSRNPDDRFPDMESLVAILAHRSSRVVRRVALATVPSLLLGLGLWSYQRNDDHVAGFCDAQHGLEETWSRETRTRTREALLDTGVPYAETVHEETVNALDTWVTTWSEQRQEACALESKRPDALASRRVQCLLEQRAQFVALLDLVSEADAEFVRRAGSAVESLPDPTRCGAQADLAAHPPMSEPALRIAEGLAKPKVLATLGRYEEALALVQQLHDEASELDQAPILAETTFARGNVLARMRRTDEARAALEEAAWVAVEGRHPVIAVRAWSRLAWVHAALGSDIEQARRAIRAGRAHLATLGDDRSLEITVLMNEATVAHMAGDYQETAEHLEAVLSLFEGEPRSLRRADVIYNLAALEVETGDYEASAQHLREYLEIYTPKVGEVHPDVAMGHYTLGVVLARMNRYDEALDSLKTASAIERLTIGEATSQHVDTLGALAGLLTVMGRPSHALPHLERAIELTEQLEAPESLQLAEQRIALVAALTALKRLDEAQDVLARARGPLEAALGTEHPQLAMMFSVATDLALARGDLELAETEARRTLEARRRALPNEHPAIATRLVALVEILIERGDRVGARAELHTLLHERETDQIHPNDRAWSRFLHARLEREEEPEQATRSARAARAELHDLGAVDRVRIIDAWLAEHD